MDKKRIKTKIVISRNSGFCFGVRRALDIAERTLRKRDTVYSLGPIIHNPQVVREFSGKGLRVIKDIAKIDSGKDAAVLIPSHGVSPAVLKKRRFDYIDTTCPLVGRVQKIVKGLKKKGYFILIVGNGKHPEVKGLKGIAGKNSLVLKNRKEARALRLKPKKVALISQTTAPLSSFKEILYEIAKKDFTELAGFNTVCRNTVEREKAARGVAEKVDAMLVIGGKESANTSKLAEACRKINRRTYHIEDRGDLKTKFVKNKKSIGIATGASTPPYAIRQVLERIRRIDK